ncbi:MAG: ABC transporter permease [Phycisphaerae bacterium]
MKPVVAIARLTFWEGIRMRIVLVFLVALVFILLLLPTALRGDGTLAGRLQTFLSYSLGAVTALLGMATVFLSCSTLSNEIRYFQIHMVIAKPVSRFQILLGKWLGVLSLNVVILALCGVAIYSFARIVKNQSVGFERDRVNINSAIWTSRIRVEPVRPVEEWTQAALAHVQSMVASGEIPTMSGERKITKADLADPALAQAFEQRFTKEELAWRLIGNNEFRDFRFENLPEMTDPNEIIQVRFRARGLPLPLEELLKIEWQVIDPETGQAMGNPILTDKRSAQRHQFLLRGAPVIRDGKMVLRVSNPFSPSDDVKIMFEQKNALELLYTVGSFEANFVRALLTVLLQLVFLSAVGLFFSTFVSFPIACLCTFTAYIIGLAMPFWLESIGATIDPVMLDAEHDPYWIFGPFVRSVLVPMLYLFPDFTKFNGGAMLVDGELIGTRLLAEASIRTFVSGALLLLGVGWLVFRQREIAAVTV